MVVASWSDFSTASDTGTFQGTKIKDYHQILEHLKSAADCWTDTTVFREDDDPNEHQN